MDEGVIDIFKSPSNMQILLPPSQIDFVSVPFVHTGKDIEECRKVLQE
jgi:pyruvate kinase